ncbi:hypothetical protein RND71_009488 [Anisodus tanguticus]|uniref:Uncharacterized protein n=1 Tax=Anisodus tanguticus TaxID=243964 RepID=A0AAE1VH95_9SOLA|nr:hypothetical protein RND71_009488 [Anisodus tanguticus]
MGQGRPVTRRFPEGSGSGQDRASRKKKPSDPARPDLWTDLLARTLESIPPRLDRIKLLINPDTWGLDIESSFRAFWIWNLYWRKVIGNSSYKLDMVKLALTRLTTRTDGPYNFVRSVNLDRQNQVRFNLRRLGYLREELGSDLGSVHNENEATKSKDPIYTLKKLAPTR